MVITVIITIIISIMENSQDSTLSRGLGLPCCIKRVLGGIREMGKIENMRDQFIRGD